MIMILFELFKLKITTKTCKVFLPTLYYKFMFAINTVHKLHLYISNYQIDSYLNVE